jgi:hypothetical protein
MGNDSSLVTDHIHHPDVAQITPPISSASDFPLHQFHGDEVDAAVLFDRVNDDDVGMVERGECLGFARGSGRAVPGYSPATRAAP